MGPGRLTELRDEAALDTFLASEDIALVEFYTEGCGICRSMEPVLGNVARDRVDVAVATINPRDDPPLIERFEVRSVPLLVLFVDETPVARRADGFVGGDDLAAWIDEHVV
ncbi:thioredoxin family protein [Halorubrum vacuolatum]|uniref:thioredoxin family protein n=1 Tax=Halorubrum vacuolatum TaxID=63740 RepID=UPI001FE94A15|nr:thioredoxin family protein [Halorubrum vacuolatum]